MKANRQYRLLNFLLPMLVCLSGASQVNAADDLTDLTLTGEPMFLSGAADPNIVFTIDDSGSMEWEMMPDDIRISNHYYMFPIPNHSTNPLYDKGGDNYNDNLPNFNDNNLQNYYFRSSENNKIFYDPDVTYTPWIGVDKDGDEFEDMDPKKALYNPYDDDRGKIDLTEEQTIESDWFENLTGDGNLNSWTFYNNSDHTFYPITYYLYNGGSKTARSSYTRVQVSKDTDEDTTFTSPGGITRTRDEEMQNFANWFSYYRSRILLTRAATSRAFSTLPENYRIGFAAINYTPNVWLNGSYKYSYNVMVSGVEAFAGSARDDFFENLFDNFSSGGTPLLRALYKVGDYYYNNGSFHSQGPWSKDPGGTAGETDPKKAERCRRSFNIMMTDGYYYNSDYYQPTIDGSKRGTLGEIAAYYYDRDLQPAIEDNEFVNRIDILNDGDFDDYADNGKRRPHMTNYTIGLGVTGDMAIPELDADIPTSWTTTSTNAGKIDDLMHAATASAGRFFASANAEELAYAISTALSGADPGLKSGGSVALNSGALFNGSMLFQGVFSAEDWSGRLDIYLINAAGGLPASPSASFTLPQETALSPRNIATYGYPTDPESFAPANDATGIAFTATALANAFTKDDVTLLDTIEPDVTRQLNGIKWLRGDVTVDILSGYRDRTNSANYTSGSSPMGDIVHSAPVYAGEPNARYYNWGSGEDEHNASYAAFKTANCVASNESCVSPTRDEMVYVGANDGMLHMFKVKVNEDGTAIETAEEVGAYIPGAVIAEGNLNNLYAEDYAHDYFVDDTPNVGDAYIDANGDGNKEWQTVLVGGLRGGGRGIYAINVTDTAALQSDLPSQVMWEFTDEDLGYTYSRPNIVRLPNGDWGVIFGNGYNSDDANDHAHGWLYVLDLATGELIKKIKTEHGNKIAPASVTYKNGLATVAPIDVNNDFIIDYVYAGDLYGNLWRFDFIDESSWDVSYGNDEPIFTAVGPNGEVQPITVRPQVTRHPEALGGYLVHFGTGKYIDITDRTALSPETVTQTVYTVWDRNEKELEPFSRSHLLQQQIVVESDINDDINNDGTDESYGYRVTTSNSISWYVNPDGTEGGVPSPASYTSGYLGWYMDLVNTEGGNTDTRGERIVSDPVIRNGRLIFTTLQPDNSVCTAEDTGWLMEIDANSGSRLDETPFDVNEDGTFSVADYYALMDTNGDGSVDDDDRIPVSGRKSNVGILPTPGILSDYDPDGQDKEHKFMSGSTGKIETVLENPGGGTAARSSWIELRVD